MNTETNGIADCGHIYQKPGPQGGAAGYATDRETGKTRCYSCADKVEEKALLTASNFFAYLSSDKKRITTWTGGNLMTVTDFKQTGEGFGGRRVRVQATDVHGQHWSGSGPCDSGTYVRLRKKK